MHSLRHPAANEIPASRGAPNQDRRHHGGNRQTPHGPRPRQGDPRRSRRLRRRQRADRQEIGHLSQVMPIASRLSKTIAT